MPIRGELVYTMEKGQPVLESSSIMVLDCLSKHLLTSVFVEPVVAINIFI